MVPGATAEAPAGAERIGAGIGRISNLVRSKVPMDFRKSLDFQFQLISEEFQKSQKESQESTNGISYGSGLLFSWQ
jgi:hypothetical protein